MTPERFYKHTNEALCKRCGATISWFLTPAGKKMPFDHKAVIKALQDEGIPPRTLDPGYTVDAAAARTLLLPHNHFATCGREPWGQ